MTRFRTAKGGHAIRHLLPALTMTLALEGHATGPITGTVYEDRGSLGLREHLTPVAGVTVKLFRDGGDGIPGAGDPLVETTRTNATGEFVLRSPPAGTEHWVVVDSTTFASGAWPDQTMGPEGSLCARPSGRTVEILFEGSCFGGRTHASDDPSSAATAEHIARASSITGPVNFAFSFDVVTTTADGPRVQGSLRQFVVNANERKGDNRMRFVPVEAPNETRSVVVGATPRWWAIALAAPLPPLVDAGTWIDGTAWNFLSPASRSDWNEGRRGEAATMQPGERAVPHLEYPELELRFAGGEALVCEASCGVRALAMNGAATSVIARADATLEQLVIGAGADVLPAGAPGSAGVEVERGLTAARLLYVTGQTQSGVIVGPGARLDAERIEVTRCGTPQSGGAVVLLSNGSSVRTSTIAANDGVGFLVGAPNGSAPANGNRIEGCTISSNQAGVVIAPASSGNTLIRNDIMWNRFGGITTVSVEGAAAAIENRFSANRFSENGIRPIMLDSPAEASPAQRSAALTSTCRPDPARVNGGITPPLVTAVRILESEGRTSAIVSGRACPGHIIEIYQSHAAPAGNQAASASLESAANQAPSVGEFNFLGATNAGPDGSFEAAFPLPTANTTVPSRQDGAIADVWAREVMVGGSAAERAFSASATDPAGNTSELGPGVSAR